MLSHKFPYYLEKFSHIPAISSIPQCW